MSNFESKGYILVKHTDVGGVITANRNIYFSREDAVRKNIDLIKTGQYDVIEFHF